MPEHGWRQACFLRSPQLPRPVSPHLLPPASCVRQNGDNMQNHAESISRVFESQAEWAQWSLNLFPRVSVRRDIAAGSLLQDDSFRSVTSGCLCFRGCICSSRPRQCREEGIVREELGQDAQRAFKEAAAL